MVNQTQVLLAVAEVMPMSADASLAFLIAAASGASWLVSLIIAVVKGRDWVEATALAALKSEAGRDAIMRMNRDHLDVKLDAIAERVVELSGRIDGVGNKIERRLDKLDADMQAMHVRVTLLEQRKSDSDKD